MATSLRQRHSNHPTKQIEDHDYEQFVEKYETAFGRQSPGASGGAPAIGALVLAGVIAIVIMITTITGGGSASGTEQNLKLITFYPRSVTHRVRDYLGQTELLITDDNREVVDAIRTSIGMANNLKNGGLMGRRKRKGGIKGFLLSISNAIAYLGSSGEKRRNHIRGDVVLESMDFLAMREYLLENGSRCSDNFSDSVQNENNLALRRFDEAIALIKSDEIPVDMMWSYASQICMWCQFSNGDSRGFIEYGTNLNQRFSTDIQTILEDSRIKGIGIAVQQKQVESISGYGVRLSPLFILPATGSGRAKTADMARNILQKLINDVPAELISRSSNATLPRITDVELNNWFSREQTSLTEKSKNIHTDKNGDEFILLDVIVSTRGSSSMFSWLAQYCPATDDYQDTECSFVIKTNPTKSR